MERLREERVEARRCDEKGAKTGSTPTGHGPHRHRRLQQRRRRRPYSVAFIRLNADLTDGLIDDLTDGLIGSLIGDLIGDVTDARVFHRDNI